MEVNAYGNTNSVQANAQKRKVSDKTGLDINDFMTLLATQLSNQDIMNPQSDTEFIAQMAQFTSLQAMSNIADMAQTQYAASMVGKKVIVADINNGGDLNTDTGCVERVKFVDGQTVLTVNGKDYGLASVMEVLADSKETETPEEKPEENPAKPEEPQPAE